MSTETTGKLQSVLNTVPNGYLVDAKWLTQNGIAYETFRDYVNRGWLTRVAQGVFQRPDGGPLSEAPIDWRACLLSLQHIMQRNLHVGGATALAEHGYSHYLPLGQTSPLWVYGSNIPNWLVKLPLDRNVITRKPTTVRDNGSGIDDLDELFEPFYTTKEPGDGVGLGLAISSGIVNDLGGRLTARNGTNGGAVFEVRLPVLAAEVAAAE